MESVMPSFTEAVTSLPEKIKKMLESVSVVQTHSNCS